MNGAELLTETPTAGSRARRPFARRVVRRLKVELFKLLARIGRLTSKLVYALGRFTGVAVKDRPIEYRNGELDVTVRRYIELIDFMKAARIATTSSVLDVGCAPGRLAERLYETGFTRIAGCDWKAESDIIASVRGRLAYSRVNLNADGLASYHDQSADVIICSDVLEHLENPARMLREFARVVAPGGHVFLTLPNAFNLLERWHIMKTGNSSRYRSERHTAPFSHISMLPTWVLESLCDRAGLEIDEQGKGFMWWNYFWLPKRRFSHLWSYYAYYHLVRKVDR